MNTAYGQIHHLIRGLPRPGVPLLSLGLALAALVLVTSLVVVELLQPGPQTIVAAPVRW